MTDETPTLRKGDIVRSTNMRLDGHHRRGVVMCDPLRPGERAPWGSAIASTGDVVIGHSRAGHTTTNMHQMWEPVPPEETTAVERVVSAAQTWTDDGTDNPTSSPAYAWIQALVPHPTRQQWADGTDNGSPPANVDELIHAIAGTIDAAATARFHATAGYQPCMAHLGDDQPESDLAEFVRLEAIVPPEVRDTWAYDYPSSVHELVLAIAEWFDSR